MSLEKTFLERFVKDREHAEMVGEPITLKKSGGLMAAFIVSAAEEVSRGNEVRLFATDETGEVVWGLYCSSIEGAENWGNGSLQKALLP